MAYFTQKKVSEMLSLSTVTINKYIADLTPAEKKGKFNDRNQPNEQGIELLKTIKAEKNQSYEPAGYVKAEELEKTIESLKKENERLKIDLNALNDEKSKKDSEILKLTQEKADLAIKYADNFERLANQQQQLQAQVNALEAGKKEILMLEQKLEEKEANKQAKKWYEFWK